MRSYRDLIVWQKSVTLVTDVYRLTARLPRSEEFALAAQMRRAAVPIAANIAEGHGRPSTRDYLRFINMAAGSVRELETCCTSPGSCRMQKSVKHLRFSTGPMRSAGCFIPSHASSDHEHEGSPRGRCRGSLSSQLLAPGSSPAP